MEWFKDNKKKVGDIITTRIHEVLKTGVKVAIDKDKKLIITIRKADLAKDAADQRPEVFSPGNALDAKITELDLKLRRVKLSVKAAQIDEEKSLIAKFGAGATKSGATLKGIFEKAGIEKRNYDKELFLDFLSKEVYYVDKNVYKSSDSIIIDRRTEREVCLNIAHHQQMTSNLLGAYPWRRNHLFLDSSGTIR